MAERKYWLDLFTGKTWEEFLKNGAQISGFKEIQKSTAQKIKVGDLLICYITGISRIIGVLEVISECFIDKTPIWEDDIFPVRLRVKLLHKLNPETAIPIHDIIPKLEIYKKFGKNWRAFLRRSPKELSAEDGNLILEEIKKALEKPVVIEYDEKRYWCGPRKIYESKGDVVTIPEKEPEEIKITRAEKSTHDEIQYLLLKFGSEMGLDVWVARNDLGKEFSGTVFKEIPRLRKELPRQFDDATNKTIENIDVLWLQGDAIVAAFEIEHTTSIYSGLLRMSDLVSMQPNIKINLYIVAPDERRDKVIEEINRPTFAKLKPPLNKICKFIPYSKLKEVYEKTKDYVKHFKPEFIDEVAESCKPDEI